jgi:hypothetical protein
MQHAAAPARFACAPSRQVRRPPRCARAAARRAKAPPPAEADDSAASDADAGASGDPLSSQRAHLRVSDGFLPTTLAKSLRGAFEKHFAEPRVTRAEDFCWNYWRAPAGMRRGCLSAPG